MAPRRPTVTSPSFWMSSNGTALALKVTCTWESTMPGTMVAPGKSARAAPGKRAASSARSPTATMRSPCTATVPRASGSRPVPSTRRSAEIRVTGLPG